MAGSERRIAGLSVFAIRYRFIRREKPPSATSRRPHRAPSPCPCPVRLDLAERRPGFLQIAQVSDRPFMDDGGFACTDRSGEHAPLVGRPADLRRDFARPGAELVDHGLLVPEAGIGLPSWAERGVLHSLVTLLPRAACGERKEASRQASQA